MFAPRIHHFELHYIINYDLFVRREARNISQDGHAFRGMKFCSDVPNIAYLIIIII